MWHAPHLPDLLALQQQLAYSPAGWTIALGCTVLAIGQSFEEATHHLKHAVPRMLLPVVNAILGEVATLGFSGIVVGSLGLGNADGWFGQLSEAYLGRADEAFEIFEAVDSSFLPVTLAFVSACSLLIAIVNANFQAFSGSTNKEALLARLADDDEPRGRPAAERRAPCGLLLSSFAIDGADGMRVCWWVDAVKDLWAPTAQRRAEFLRFRARFLEQQARMGSAGLPNDFAFGRYLQEAAAETLAGLVQVEPFQLLRVWGPLLLVELLMLQAVGGLDDGLFVPRLIMMAQAPIAVWSAWNFFRMWYLRALLLPQLATPSAEVGSKRLLPPRYALLGGSGRLKGSVYDRVALVERAFPAASHSRHEQLFGRLGKNGPAFYLNSMKLVLFSSIGSLAFVGSGGAAGCAADVASALAPTLAGSGGDADGLVSILGALVSAATFFPSAAAVMLTPFTFLNYNWVTSVEGLRRDSTAEAVAKEQRAERFRSTLNFLASLCEWMEAGLMAGHECAGETGFVIPTADADATSPSAAYADADASLAKAAATNTIIATPTTILSTATTAAATATAAAAPTVAATSGSAARGHRVVGQHVVSRRSAAEVEARWALLLTSVPIEQLLDVRALFDRLDDDRSGSIGLTEIQSIARQLGFRPSPQRLEALFGQMDVDGSGEVSYVEFATALVALPGGGGGDTGSGGTDPTITLLSAAARRRVFAFFDADGSGEIDKAEMLSKLAELGFDQRGVDELYAEMGQGHSAGAAPDRVSMVQFERYLERSGGM